MLQHFNSTHHIQWELIKIFTLGLIFPINKSNIDDGKLQ
jgi:hypothetical protein